MKRKHEIIGISVDANVSNYANQDEEEMVDLVRMSEGAPIGWVLSDSYAACFRGVRKGDCFVGVPVVSIIRDPDAPPFELLTWQR